MPFGGGTSVVGGVDPHAGPHGAAIALDLGRLGHCEVDQISMTASLGPGLRGPEAEAALAAHGVTLGHFPQSFEYATIGGFAATRSAGQASAGYGRFDELVTAIEMLAPAGRVATLATPHTAAGPALRELIVGSEGTLGVITDVTVRVRPAPEVTRYEGWIVEDFASGAETVRALAHADRLPDVTRLSDAEETRISLALSGTAGLKRAALDAYLRLRRRTGGCMMIVGWEGEPEDVERRRALSSRTLRDAGAVKLGAAPGRAWSHGRFEGPYLRDELLDLGYFVETLETSHTWSRYEELYRAVGDALRGALSAEGTPGLVWCHLSHAYRDGASLYFTFVAAPQGGGRDRAVASGEERGLRGDRRDRRHDHPSPRGRARPRAVHAGRGGRGRHRGPASPEGASRPRRDHESRQAPAGALALLALILGLAAALAARDLADQDRAAGALDLERLRLGGLLDLDERLPGVRDGDLDRASVGDQPGYGRRESRTGR